MAKHIFIVEDDVLILDSLEMAITAEGYQVTTAKNGVEVLDLLNTIRPDLVLTDIRMGMMNGFELCRRLKKSPDFKDIPVVILSARTREADQFFSDYTEPDAYLTKPIDMKVLLETIRRLLKSVEGTS